MTSTDAKKIFASRRAADVASTASPAGQSGAPWQPENAAAIYQHRRQLAAARNPTRDTGASE
jgi:hypothetical protein